MTETLLAVIQPLQHHRALLAVLIPVLGGALVVATQYLMPLGRARGFITGAYMLLTALGAACLLFALAGAVSGIPITMLVPLFIPGITLAVVMGVFTPEAIREYQLFEFRKLAAEIFRRS